MEATSNKNYALIPVSNKLHYGSNLQGREWLLVFSIIRYGESRGEMTAKEFNRAIGARINNGRQENRLKTLSTKHFCVMDGENIIKMPIFRELSYYRGKFSWEINPELVPYFEPSIEGYNKININVLNAAKCRYSIPLYFYLTLQGHKTEFSMHIGDWYRLLSGSEKEVTKEKERYFRESFQSTIDELNCITECKLMIRQPKKQENHFIRFSVTREVAKRRIPKKENIPISQNRPDLAPLGTYFNNKIFNQIPRCLYYEIIESSQTISKAMKLFKDLEIREFKDKKGKRIKNLSKYMTACLMQLFSRDIQSKLKIKCIWEEVTDHLRVKIHEDDYLLIKGKMEDIVYANNTLSLRFSNIYSKIVDIIEENILTICPIIRKRLGSTVQLKYDIIFHDLKH